MKNNLTILLTGCGAPGTRGTLYSLRNNFDSLKINVIGTDINRDVIGRYWVDDFYTLPAPERPDYIDHLIYICKREHVDLVIPQTTREISILSKNKDLVSDIVRVMVSSEGAVLDSNNKHNLLKVFEECDLPYPKYILTRTEDELRNSAFTLGYPKRPIVVKPPVSNGMRGFRILMENAWNMDRFLREKPSGVEVSLDELLRIIRTGHTWPELLLTEFLPGPEYSVDAFSGQHCSIAVPRIRKSIRSGISFDNDIEFRNDLIEFTTIAARRLALQYAFGFQYKLDAFGTPKVLECNPRVQGTMVASFFCGVNIIWLAVREIMGDPVTYINITDKEAHFKRFWGGIGITNHGEYEI